MPTAAIALGTALAWSGLLAAPESPAAGSWAVIPHCQVNFLDDVNVPALEAGPLVALHVKEGDSVQTGQLLALIDDRQAQTQKLAAELEHNAAQARAEDDIDIRFAVKSLELSELEVQQDLEINRKSPGAVPESEVRRKQLAKTRAELQVDRSRLDLKLAQVTAEVQNAALRGAEESILRRRVVAPFNGLVIDIQREVAEWVNAGDPVLRVACMDRLRVEGFLDASQGNAADVADRPVTVEIELAQGRKERFQGKVVFVNPMVQAGNKYRVRGEVQNREERGQPLLCPGMTATMAIQTR